MQTQVTIQRNLQALLITAISIFAFPPAYGEDDDKGWMPVNKYNAYSFNNVTAKKNEDKSITIHFGGDPKQPNFLPIVPGTC